MSKELYDAMVAEAERIDRPIGWLLQHMWDMARKSLAALPTVKKEH